MRFMGFFLSKGLQNMLTKMFENRNFEIFMNSIQHLSEIYQNNFFNTNARNSPSSNPGFFLMKMKLLCNFFINFKFHQIFKILEESFKNNVHQNIGFLDPLSYNSHNFRPKRRSRWVRTLQKTFSF